MGLKEIANVPFGGQVKDALVTVRYTENLFDEKDFEAITDNRTTYFFTAVLFKEEGEKYYFSDAHTHRELKAAINEEILTAEYCVLSQVYLGNDGKISQVMFFSPFDKSEKRKKARILEFLDKINPDFLRDNITISKSHQVYEYFYFKKDRRFQKID